MDIDVAVTYIIVDCPLNKQVECEEALNLSGFSGLVQFKTSQEIAEEQEEENKEQRGEIGDEDGNSDDGSEESAEESESEGVE